MNDINNPTFATYSNTFLIELEQLSLNSYMLHNKGNHIINYDIYEYTLDGWEIIGDTQHLPIGENGMINISNDGIFKIDIYMLEDDEHELYLIHNIESMLLKRQDYITQTLLNGKMVECDSHSYYDYINFNVLFDSYLDLTRQFINREFSDTSNILHPTVIPDNMYDIKVIYNEILKYI